VKTLAKLRVICYALLPVFALISYFTKNTILHYGFEGITVSSLIVLLYLFFCAFVSWLNLDDVYQRWKKNLEWKQYNLYSFLFGLSYVFIVFVVSLTGVKADVMSTGDIILTFISTLLPYLFLLGCIMISFAVLAFTQKKGHDFMIAMGIQGLLFFGIGLMPFISIVTVLIDGGVPVMRIFIS
jgi:hypothetical protein